MFNNNQITTTEIEGILKDKISYKKGNLLNIVSSVLKDGNKIKKLVIKHKTPFYVYNQRNLDNSIKDFLKSFKREIPLFKAYYAIKINHHPLIIKRAVENGMGLDVGSPREIDIAINAGCKDIIYFSPGKTETDLFHALKYNDYVTINMDSYSELRKLGDLTNKVKKGIRAGIRIHTDQSGSWKKYGIHVNDLKDFFEKTKKYPLIEFSGIHFHMSRNKDARFYENTIKEIASYLKKSFSPEELKKIKYIDFGGGFEVYKSEGHNPKQTPHFIRDAIKIDEYAKRIGRAIRTYLEPIIKATYYSEPGRIICNNAMYIVLSVADVKNKENVVLNGGVNMVGWQRFEHEYFPLINLSSPSRKEIKCNMWGNLCTTWDIWGYFCHANRIREGDIIVVPNQGALTYSLAQNFIQPIPPVYKI